jgi:hypothetical protein
VVGRDVDGAPVDPSPAAHFHPRVEELCGRRRSRLTRELERRLGGSPSGFAVAVAVPVPEEIEPAARTELDDIQRPAVCDRQEAW